MRKAFAIFAVAVLAPSVALSTVSAQEPPRQVGPQHDWLDLANGAVLLSATSQYDPGPNSARGLIAGTPEKLWSTALGETGPQEIVIELAQPVRLATFAIDNTGIEIPDRSSRIFELWGTSIAPDGEYAMLVEGDAPREARGEFTIESDEPVRWLRLIVQSNWGDALYIKIAELEAYGEPAGDAAFLGN